MSTSLSSSMIADYKTKLIPKKILQDKMNELLDSFEKKNSWFYCLYRCSAPLSNGADSEAWV